jgi:hypothetical protein
MSAPKGVARNVGYVWRAALCAVIVVPIFWAIACPLWLPFTPVWFDVASFGATGVATVVALALGRKGQKPKTTESTSKESNGA